MVSTIFVLMLMALAPLIQTMRHVSTGKPLTSTVLKPDGGSNNLPSLKPTLFAGALVLATASTFCGSLEVVSVAPAGPVTCTLYVPARAGVDGVRESPLLGVGMVMGDAPPLGVSVTVRPLMPASVPFSVPSPLLSRNTWPLIIVGGRNPTLDPVTSMPFTAVMFCGSLA